MANEYLRRTPTSTGNRRVWTASLWYKMSSAGAFFGAGDGSTAANSSHWWFNSDQLGYSNNDGTNYVTVLRKSRDFSSWSHYMLVVDTTKVEPYDRVVFYENGVRNEVDTTSGYTNPSRNAELSWINQLWSHHIGARNRAGANTFSTGEYCDFFFIDGQALTPDVFGFYKQGKGYISAGSTQATDFRPGQWVPKTPRVIKTEINRRGGFGVNGFYLPMNDSRNFGADFHGDPNSIITLNEKLPQPRVGVATTASVGLGYTDALRADPYAANLVLALPFVSSGLCTNGTNVGVNTGFGDYSHIIRGSGSAKVGIVTGGVSIANTASYYGSAGSFNAVGALSFDHSADFNFGSGDWTIETWRWRERVGTVGEPYVAKYAGSASNADFFLAAQPTGAESIYWYDGTNIYNITSSSGICTSRQWDHIAAVRKGNIISLYVNGACVGINTTVTYSLTNSSTQVRCGITTGFAYTFSGYLQDLRIYKGVAKYTGGFDVPRPYTPVGIATWRAVPDTTANNFATWNPVSPASDTTFTNGNLTVAYGSNSTRGVVTGTVGIAVTGSGKYYWENRIDASSASPTNAMIGVWGMSTSTSNGNYPGFTNTYGWSYYGYSGQLYTATGGALSNTAYGSSYTTGDIISVALDMTANNGSLTFYKNGVSQGVATTGIGAYLTNGNIHAIMPALGDGGSATTHTVSSNFGQNPTFSGNVAAAGTFTDSNGKGLFKYQPPSGFLALCEDNLPTPAISNPGQYFKTVLYTGDNRDGRSIVGVGFTPDLVWVKSRNAAYGHVLFDSVRGPYYLLSFTTGGDNSAGTLGWASGGGLSMLSDGFNVAYGTNESINGSGTNFVAWCWRAGAGTTSTNTNGSITSVVSVNQDAGFSIVSFGGNGSTGTVGHGLGKTPRMIIQKPRNASGSWAVYHASLGAGNAVWLNLTDASSSYPTVWNSTTPTSSVYSVGSYMGTSNYIAYCWAEIEGFSKFGSYVGNGNADGPFVYCGFKPAFVLVKNASATVSWTIVDNARDSVNSSFNSILFPDLSEVENAGANKYYDFVSNGFKIRGASSAINANGNTMIFAAFAESPFAYSNSK